MKKPRLEAFDPNPAAEQPKPHREGRSRITYGISPLSKSSFYRLGMKQLIDDYDKHGEQSILIRSLREKKAYRYGMPLCLLAVKPSDRRASMPVYSGGGLLL
jgi:hypothetical protein